MCHRPRANYIVLTAQNIIGFEYKTVHHWRSVIEAKVISPTHYVFYANGIPTGQLSTRQLASPFLQEKGSRIPV